MIGAQGEVVRVIGALSDVTESKAAEERILHDAIHDNLTGLPNRELFFDRLDSALIHARRPGSPRPAVIVVDVDRLQAVNDSMGMSFGDSALLTVARRAARDLKPGDTLARLGGDQFAAITMIEGDAARASAFGDALRALLANPISFGDREISLTASIGVALYEPELHTKGLDLFGDAEIALANAKKGGGDRAVLFVRGMRASRDNRGGLEGELRAGRSSAARLWFCSNRSSVLEDRTVAGFEATPRWRHPRLGMLGPSEFQSATDASGVKADISALTLETTARELAAWQRALEVVPPIFASLNISSRQMLGQDLLADLRAALNRHNVLRGTLKLEMTESLVMENPEYAAQLLPRAHELGAGLALDNFGAGYTSLSHLERYRFDTLKIDPALARPNGAGGRPLVLRSIVSMAHDLGMDVIVDGAETESDAVELSQMGL